MKKIISIFLAVALMISSLLALPAIAGEATGNRYTILVLDVSAGQKFTHKETGETLYISDPAVNYAKAAAQSFVENLSENDYIAVVGYASYSFITCNFTKDKKQAQYAINHSDEYIISGEPVNIDSGLTEANRLIDSPKNASGENIVFNEKDEINVVLFTTGCTAYGSIQEDGYFDSSFDNGGVGYNGNNLYLYANKALNTADIIKTKADIYVFGLFQAMSELETITPNSLKALDFFKRTAEKLASSPNFFYPVNDIDNFNFVFSSFESIYNEEYITGDFFYRNKGTDKNCRYYYSDNYFNHDDDGSKVYNPSLAAMSMCLAWSAFNAPEKNADSYEDDDPYINSFINAESLLQDIGFSEIEPNEWFKNKPTDESIGVIFGQKQIKYSDNENCTLIAVGIRGGEYEQEWISNVTVGLDGQHEGFDEAKDQVVESLKKYIKDNGISGRIKLWITGYSRAAAVANLVGGYIDNAIDEKTLNIHTNKEDVYVYTFETPAGSLSTITNNDKDKYPNIFNVINAEDLVTYVAPETMGFDRYGQDVYLPSNINSARASTQKQRMIELYDQFDYIDNYEPAELLTNNFWECSNNTSVLEFIWSESFTLLSHIIGMREGYVDNGCQELLQNIFTKKDKPSSKETVADDVIIDALIALNIPRVSKLLACYENIANITSYIGSKHYPELCFSWLASMDTNYTENPIFCFNNGSFRCIHVNCAVDVNVYNENNNLVASIISDNPVDIENSSIVTVINEGGEKLIYLPFDAEYRIETIAREDDTVNFNISEYCPDEGGYTRNINYFDIPVAEGDTLTVSVPKGTYSDLNGTITDGSRIPVDVEGGYSVSDAEGIINNDSELAGTEAVENYFEINAYTENTEGGTVSGSGYKNYGHFVKVSAIANENFIFSGWYLNNQLVSEDAEYRFRVTDNIDIEARFEAEPTTEPDKPEDPATEPEEPTTTPEMPTTKPDEPADEPNESYQIEQQELQLIYKDKDKLNTVVNGTKEFYFVSSNPDVVTVDDYGNITAKSTGTATVSMYIVNDGVNEIQDTCTVIVKYSWWQWIIRILFLGFLWY